MNSSTVLELENLLQQARQLGNHHQKYLQLITKYGEQLTALIIDQGWDEQINPVHLSAHPRNDLRLISKACASRADHEQLLACYYAFQLIALNLKAIDLLQLHLATTTNNYEVYRQFLIQTGNDFRRLTAAYMAVLLELYLPPTDQPEFVICGVGTRVDQDDIDLGIIDDGESGRSLLNQVFGKLNTTMLKSASTLHFHLSEHVGTGGYSASIQDYHRLLDHRIGDCVILSEMLNAVPILGSQPLFKRFKNEILQRYFYQASGDNQYHEGFLRGILGEVRDLLYRHPPEDWLHPKRDALRMIKALLFTFKTWQSIDHLTSLEVLQALRQSRTPYQPQFEQLFQALAFFETFRFLYQLFIVQEEEIDLSSEDSWRNLQQVALYMGYSDNSLAPAYRQLLMQYGEQRRLANQAATALLQPVYAHLRRISSFHYQKFNPSRTRNLNLPLQFIQQARFFEGVRYWDDVLTQLFNPNKVLIRRFIQDFAQLPPYRQQIIRQTYLQWGFHTPNALMTLLISMARAKPELSNQPLFQEFLHGYLIQFPTSQEHVDRFFQIVNFAPGLINDFIALLPEALLKRFLAIIEQTAAVTEDKASQRILLTLGRLYLQTSYYFRHYIYRAFQSYPQYLKELSHTENLKQLALGLRYGLEEISDPAEKLTNLSAYYNFEFLQAGLDLIHGQTIERVNREFTEFSDTFLNMLFTTCAALHNVTPDQLLTRVAFFVAGGHARQQAFDDDYDLLILVDSTDQTELALVEKTMQQVNRQLQRCAIMPHYRLAQHFGKYVTPIRDLAQYLSRPHATLFIEQSLLIGARLIVGTTRLERIFQQRILTPYIFARKEQFITDLFQEITSRRAYFQQLDIWNIKESPGGLRDFENCLFCLKAHYELSLPISRQLITILQDKLPTEAQTLSRLWQNYNWLKHIRDLYRLLVATDDQLQAAALPHLLPSLNQAYGTAIRDSQELLQQIQAVTAENVTLINRLLALLGFQL